MALNLLLGVPVLKTNALIHVKCSNCKTSKLDRQMSNRQCLAPTFTTFIRGLESPSRYKFYIVKSRGHIPLDCQHKLQRN